MRQKIIFVMAESFPYGIFWNDPKPDVAWETEHGQWVGHWRYGWYDQIGSEFSKVTDEFDFEIWQPDLRADRIYTYSYNDMLCHKLFPAYLKAGIYGIKTVRHVRSPAIYAMLLAEWQKRRILLHLDGAGVGIIRDILKIRLDTKIPTVLQFLGNVQEPRVRICKVRKNLLAPISDIKDTYSLKKLLARVDCVICSSNSSKNVLAKYCHRDVCILPIGIDLDFWRPRLDKGIIRKRLGLGIKQFIVLSSCRFSSTKQIDKMINILNELDSDFDFQYVITGHGEQTYEDYLSRLGASLIRKHKLKFVGYVSERTLIDYYDAADLFISTSLFEGGPVSAVKALAMEKPTFVTDTGFVSELLRHYSAGVVVPVANYDIWKHELIDILRGKHVPVLDRGKVEALYDWPNVVRRYERIYRCVLKRYQKNNG